MRDEDSTPAPHRYLAAILRETPTLKGPAGSTPLRMFLSLMPLPVAVATTSELMLSHSHNAVRMVLLGALVDRWVLKPPVPQGTPGSDSSSSASATNDTKGRAQAGNGVGKQAKARPESTHGTNSSARTGARASAKTNSSGSRHAQGEYPDGVAQFWDLLREFLLGDPVKGVRLAVLDAVVQVGDGVVWWWWGGGSTAALWCPR